MSERGGPAPEPNYSSAFYNRITPGSTASAEVVLAPIIEAFAPRSVVDFGCGTGAWLSVAKRFGVATVLGLDGSYVSPDELVIERDEFRASDLSEQVVADEQFDLVMSLEVAEHLPAARAAGLVDDLTRFGDLVLFSAALKGQGGRDHVNEQPPSYWAALFANAGFTAFDVVRPRIWADSRVEPWYRQNLLLYVRTSRSDLLEIAGHLAIGLTPPIDIVHPETLVIAREVRPLDLRTAAEATVRAAAGALRRRVKRLTRRLARSSG